MHGTKPKGKYALRGRLLKVAELEVRAVPSTVYDSPVIDESNTDPDNAQAAAPTAGHENGCGCGSCSAYVDANGMTAYALSPPDERLIPVGPKVTKAPPFPTADTLKLHSRASASKKIYLDFDGHTATGTGWNTSYNNGNPIIAPIFSFEGDVSTTFTTNEHERIQNIWRRIAEDFAPFDVDVTTEDPGVAGLTYSGSGDTTWGIRCVMTTDDAWIRDNTGAIGGIAYVPSFRSSNDICCWVFTANLSSNGEKSIAEAASHEIGHTLGLGHDGRTSPAEGYYGGHNGSGTPGWAPIMGVGYYQQLATWSKGEYGSANNTQDDLAIITNTSVNFGYRPDDAGNTVATATAANQVGGSVTFSGVIERTTDVDVLSFTASAGNVTFAVNNATLSPNLDVRAEIRDAAGNVLAFHDPLDVLDANVSYTVTTPGTYYLFVDGVGVGNASTTGYSDYGSLGQYTVSGTVPTGGVAPSLANIESTSLTYIEDAAGSAVSAALTASDDANLSSATVRISNGYLNGQDLLEYTTINGITGTFTASTGVLALSGTATPAQYQAAMRSVRYLNSSQAPSTQSRTLSFQVTDQLSNTSNTVTRNVVVTPVNDAPTFNTTGTPSLPTINEDAVDNSGVLVTNLISSGLSDPISDPDQASVEGLAVVAANTTNGVWEYSLDNGASWLPLGAVSTTSGRLLAADASTRVRFVPNTNYFGSIASALTFVAWDQTSGTNGSTASVTPAGGTSAFSTAQETASITVVSVNDAPVAVDNEYSMDEDGTLVIAASGVLGNDTDVEGTSLTAFEFSPPRRGQLTLLANGGFTYRPEANFNGTDSFTYKATDGTDESNVGVVTINIAAIADPPTAIDDSVSTSVGQSVTIRVLDNDFDGDGDLITLTNFTQPAVGQVTRSGSSLIFSPPTTGIAGSTSFTYEITDGQGGYDTATVNVTMSDPVMPTVKTLQTRYGSDGNATYNLYSPSRAIMPWAGVMRFELSFSEPVTFTANAIELVGPNGVIPLSLSNVGLTVSSTIATIVGNALGNGRYSIRVVGSQVTDRNGNTMASDLMRSFAVLPGDFDGNGLVDNRDLTGIRRNYQTNRARVNRFADINGDGIVTVQDYNLARTFLNTRLT